MPSRLSQSSSTGNGRTNQQKAKDETSNGKGQRRKRRRRPKRQQTSIVGTTLPNNFTTALGAIMVTGIMGTLMNIGYVSYQTALKWEMDTTTADFTAHNAPDFPFPLEQIPHFQPPRNNLSVADNNLLQPKNPFDDKEPLLQLLDEAKMTPIDKDTAAQLPTWTQISQLYGNQPIYHGLDTCTRFQGAGSPAQHFLGIAGTFNSGTNLLAELLIANCHMPARMAAFGPRQRGIRWQVVWGKHTPVGNETFRQLHRTYTDMPELTADDVFAAVIIRDPYRWMQSMCKHPYAATWGHADSHCPSLVPNQADVLAQPHLADRDHIPVTVEYSNFTRHYQSLVHFWNEWYQEYLQAKFPYLLVRFEDLIYHPKQVVQTICECAGGEMNRGDFQYITGSAKKGVGAHGAESERTGYLQALSRYGKNEGRAKGMEESDLAFARKFLDSELMKKFQYRYHEG